MNRERLKRPRGTQPIVPTQRRPKGIAQPVSAAFKEAVQRELDERQLSRSALAAACNVTPGAITVFFRPETKVCRFVPELCSTLDLPPPEFMDDRDAEVVRDLRKLRAQFPSEYDRIAAKIRTALSRKSH